MMGAMPLPNPPTPVLSASVRRARGWWLAVAGAAALAAALYGAAMGWLWLEQEKLLFFPTILPAQQVLAQEPDVREFGVDVPGARLSVLQLQLPSPKGVVFFLHGNGGSLSNWFVNTQLYRRANFDLVMMDYRGYGKSTGSIESEAQLRADVRAVWAQVAAQYAGKRLVIYGRSLGTGLASGLSVELAAQGHAPDLTVLVSPYSSMEALAGEQYPLVPSTVLRYPLRSIEDVARLRSPLLLIHGDHDRLIPLHHSTALKAVAPQAQLLVVEGAGHNDVHKFESYLTGLGAALSAL